jgi:hypothetical protein
MRHIKGEKHALMITAILKNDEDLIEGEYGAVHGGEDD